MRQARASDCGSGVFPRLALKRLAVPEGKAHTGTPVPASACMTPLTVPSPPEATTTSKSVASRTASLGSKSSFSSRKTHSSPGLTTERWNW